MIKINTLALLIITSIVTFSCCKALAGFDELSISTSQNNNQSEFTYEVNLRDSTEPIDIENDDHRIYSRCPVVDENSKTITIGFVSSFSLLAGIGAQIAGAIPLAVETINK